MKPYEIINHIIDDLLCSHFKDDYCLLYFPDNTRYNDKSAENFMNMLHDKHLIVGHIKTIRTEQPNNFNFNYFFHNNEWLYGNEQPINLRKKTKNNFYQHSWEPIDIKLDKSFWEIIKHYDSQRNSIILHSEKNSKDVLCLKEQNIKSIEWFAHAYLCSEFYFKYYQKLAMVRNYKVRPILHKWLSANRLLRLHRTNLLEQLDVSQGCYSLANPDPNGLVYNGPVKSHSFDCHENHSAEICIDKLTPWNTSFLHIVTETVWQDKIHFTEKIFKPIVMHQPFVVVQAPGSLKYLQSYGFKTFGDWWDESYDDMQDPAERLQAIAKIINDIGGKDISELEKLRMEMAGVLEHNFHHFYENIPAIVLGELENNIRLLS